MKLNNKNNLKLLLAVDLGQSNVPPLSEVTVKEMRDLVQKLKGRLDLAFVHPKPALFAPSSFEFNNLYRKFEEAQFEKLMQLQKKVSEAGKPVLLTAKGSGARDVASTLLTFGKKGRFDFIVLSSKRVEGLKAIRKNLLGSVSDALIRKSTLPVLTFGPNLEQVKKKENQAIFIATALSPNSSSAEKLGLHLAKQLGLKVVFFYSLREAMHPVLQTAFSVAKPSPKLQALFEKLKVQSKKALEKKLVLAKEMGVTADFILDDQTFLASEAIMRGAMGANAMLIVMGTHGRSKIVDAYYGRTARDVLIGATVPVITVKSKSR